jgi:hypothetical protein
MAVPEHAQTPERWQALADCAQGEIDALALLDLARLETDCRELLVRLPAEQARCLSDLVAENRELLAQVGELERQAVARASEQLRALGAELAGLQRGVRLKGAYRGASGSARFLDGTY